MPWDAVRGEALIARLQAANTLEAWKVALEDPDSLRSKLDTSDVA